MTILYSDPFNGIADTVLQTDDPNWVQVTGAPNGCVYPIGVSTAVSSSGITNAANYRSGISWPNDGYAEVTLGALSTTADEGAGPAYRWASGSFTGFFAQSNTVDIRLYSHTVAGGYVQQGIYTATHPSVGSKVRLEVRGSGTSVSLVVKLDGTTIITATYADGANTASRPIDSGSAGLWCSNSVGQIDAFEGGDFPLSIGRAVYRKPFVGVNPARPGNRFMFLGTTQDIAPKTAFQWDSYQDNSFQIYGGGSVSRAGMIYIGGGGGGGSGGGTNLTGIGSSG